MESVGSQLRQARLKLGLTLEQASAKTRISVRNLHAIEEDDVSNISSPFFYRSFVKQFAQYLNLDYTAVEAGVLEIAGAMPEPLMPGQEGTTPADLARSKIAPLEGRRRPWNLRWISSVFSLVLVFFGCSSFYTVWESRSNWRSSLAALTSLMNPVSHEAAGSTHQKFAQMSAALPRTPLTAAPQSTPKPAASPAAPSTTAKTSPSIASAVTPADSAKAASPDSDPTIRVELSAVERTWLSITSDGKETFSGVLETAETKVLEGHQTARIRTGDAGAISFVFNGRAIGTLRPGGQVRTVVFTKDNYQILDASARLVPSRFNLSAE